MFTLSMCLLVGHAHFFGSSNVKLETVESNLKVVDRISLPSYLKPSGTIGFRQMTTVGKMATMFIR